MASGTEGKIPLPPIPKYGGVTTDEDEDAALRLPPNMPTLPKLTNENLEYEDQLSKTKLRYSRRTTGSLKEQEEDARGGLDQVQEQTPEEVINEHSHREFYCPDTKTLDFGKLRTTDLRNNNRIYLPKPGPPPRKNQSWKLSQSCIGRPLKITEI